MKKIGRKTKEFKLHEFEKILRKNEFKLVSTRGDHRKYKRNGKETIILNNKPNQMLCRRLIQEHELVF